MEATDGGAGQSKVSATPVFWSFSCGWSTAISLCESPEPSVREEGVCEAIRLQFAVRFELWATPGRR